MLDHVLAWGRWSTHVGIALSAFGAPKITARTATRKLMPRKTVTEQLLRAAIRNSSSLTRISSSEFRIQSTCPKQDHCYVQVLRVTRRSATGASLLEKG